MNEPKLPQTLKDLKQVMGSDSIADYWSSSVVFLFLKNEIIFIRRSESMPTHKGQIGFFGGNKKKSETPQETAFREFEEESSLSSSSLHFLGLGEAITTNHGKVIIPVICKTDLSKKSFLADAKSNGEWNKLIFVDISYLKDAESWAQARAYRSESTKSYQLLFCPVRSSNSYELLWGATAKMIWNFFKKHEAFDNS